MNLSPASILLGIKDFKMQAFSSLAGTDNDFSRIFKAASTGISGDSDPASVLSQNNALQGLSSNGRNSRLFDPESAYRMMSLINQVDVNSKAQYAELKDMGAYVSDMQADTRPLDEISESTDNEVLKQHLLDFVDHYNNWIDRFNPDMQAGGMLAGTQAAQISRHELEWAMGNIFNGAADGIHGLSDLGIHIDPGSHRASVDDARLDAMLASNKHGVVDTLDDFAANFAGAAKLLNADGNVISKQLNNLNKAIHYIADNLKSLQAEFGTGDAAKPTGPIARALAEYNSI